MNISPINNNKTSFGALLFADAKVPNGEGRKTDDVQILMLEAGDNFSRAGDTYFVTTPKGYKGTYKADKNAQKTPEKRALEKKLEKLHTELESAGTKAGEFMSMLVVEISNGEIANIFNAKTESKATREEIVRVKQFEASI